MKSTEKNCPMTGGAQGKCLGVNCAWYRIGTNEPDGLCAVVDIAGWLGSIHALARAPKEPPKVPGQNKMPTDPSKVVEVQKPRLVTPG